MATKDEAFQQRLLATFRTEAAERLDLLSSGLLELEQGESEEQRAASLESLVREAHSLKGASRAVNLAPVEALARGIEQVLSTLKQESTEASPALFDTLHKAVDGIRRYLSSASPGDQERAALRELLHAMEDKQTPRPPTPPPEVKPVTAEDEELPSADVEPPHPPAAEGSATTDTVRISTARLSALMLGVEQLTAAKLTTQQHVDDLRSVRHDVADWQKTLGRKAAAGAILENEKLRLRQLDESMVKLEKSAEQNVRYLAGSLANVLEEIKNVLMLPVSTALGMLAIMVRDLSRAQGKEIEWSVSGGEIEIDKRILDELHDPLIHLVRNCIDHGIEKAEVREAAGKPRRGRIALTIEQQAAHRIMITLEDDGLGMDAAAIRAAAIKQGILSPANAEILDDHAVLSLAFRSGVTTSPIVTDLSGRGLGLAIVQEKIAKLNGSLDFDTRPGAGTTFHITLPLSLATFRGVLIGCGDNLYIVPTANVVQVLRVDRDEIRTVENRTTILFRDEVVSLVQLADVLALPINHPVLERSDKTPVIVTRSGNRTIAFAVDEIHYEQEVLVKSLGKQLVRVRNISGAAALASGSLVPILNVPDLLASAIMTSAGATPLPEREAAEKKRRSLLVVEDSITTRTLLKNILQTAGYAVTTAVDGIDAMDHLRGGEFDLVVSDVAMPRMDGFDLTARIRADKRLAELPVVLVTALESQRDKERGIDVGANAYIVKSSFDQSNLLEIIRRLV
jgi:two-component system chemotaxis sensor kinase CheA